ncbi:MAG: PDZ domain-containing protein [Clostridia bacterium]|nr:PDZ domain-containing protein [Clostridia bacterium]MBQ7296671.1 PDZ domain-containing protein [Clostridia bacterium]
MVKGIKFFKCLIIAITVLTLSLTVYGFYTVPDEIYTLQGQEIGVNNLFKVTYSDDTAHEIKGSENEEKHYKVSVSLLGAIPIKNSSLTVSSRHYVVPSGEIFGLRLFTEGVVIVKAETVDTATGDVSPTENAGLKVGDVILKIDSKKVTSSNEVSNLISQGSKTSFKIEYVRNSVHYNTVLNTAYSISEGKYKAGMWIRDSAAGIGTLTFYEPGSKIFAGLGHGVCDIDTGEILPLSDGDIVSAKVSGCYKGQSGKAGELCGSFLSDSIGILCDNNSRGVYGVMTKNVASDGAVPIAMSYEVKTGKAQIIATVDEKGARYYDIEITKISPSNKENKHMVIKVTDSELIEKTGGIVQGM